MIKPVVTLILWISISVFSINSVAGSVVMIRTDLGFEAAMEVLKESIEAHGYTVAHEQKCDGGMAEFDYATDFYRVIFFGKLQEVRGFSEKYPEMIPFLPLKIALFAENKETVVVAVDPTALSPFFPQAELQTQFLRWSNDINSILGDVRDAHMNDASDTKPDDVTDTH